MNVSSNCLMALDYCRMPVDNLTAASEVWLSSDGHRHQNNWLQQHLAALIARDARVDTDAAAAGGDNVMMENDHHQLLLCGCGDDGDEFDHLDVHLLQAQSIFVDSFLQNNRLENFIQVSGVVVLSALLHSSLHSTYPSLYPLIPPHTHPYQSYIPFRSSLSLPLRPSPLYSSL